MKLINPHIVSFRGSVSDEEIKKRLGEEAIEQAGWLDVDRLPLKGVAVRVTRYGGKAGTGGYDVEVTRDLRQSDQPLLTPPHA